MARLLLPLLLACVDGSPPASTPARAPIYVNVFHHQEFVGTVTDDFADYDAFRQQVLDELALYERLGVVSDQYFSDFVVDIARRKEGDDPELCRAFRASGQGLGYHFHPTTWDAEIRLDAITSLPFWEAVDAYAEVSDDRYDWTPCIGVVPPMFCGALDPSRPGGVGFMEGCFTGDDGPPATTENFQLYHAPASLALRDLHPDLAVGVTGNVHAYRAKDQLGRLWMNDETFGDDRYTYVYRMLDRVFVRGHSLAQIEHNTSTVALKQLLATLPPDVPHVLFVHVSGLAPELEENLRYLQAFMRDNPGSRFVTAGEIPSLVAPTRPTWSLAEIDAAALALLRSWTGRPPRYVEVGDRALSLTGLFQALTLALQPRLAGGAWPSEVTIDPSALPPLGLVDELPPADDHTLYEPVTVQSLDAAIAALPPGEVPYTVALQVRTGQTGVANAGELLNGMASRYLALRRGEAPTAVQLLKGDIVPLSHRPHECSCDRCVPDEGGDTCSERMMWTPLAWYDALQLWTLEPLRLR